ncbi:29279_t:CDS:2 [Gigaspora margarita]|uniref:29279_t:CDS:1 n=1 Tax=Gigaspora margarita TaxID=4874 RepID=A0ABM8W120_GIGMA|nr:29279_t:CDS:2 [Gigaspora margarita]
MDRGNPNYLNALLPRKTSKDMIMVLVPRTNTRGRGENPQASEQTIVKELGKLAPEETPATVYQKHSSLLTPRVNGGRNYNNRCSFVNKIWLYAGKPEYPKINNFTAIVQNIIPFFQKYGFLSAKKKNDFAKFQQIAKLIEKKDHLTKEGIKKILKLREQMNDETIRQTEVDNSDDIVRTL